MPESLSMEEARPSKTQVVLMEKQGFCRLGTVEQATQGSHKFNSLDSAELLKQFSELRFQGWGAWG